MNQILNGSPHTIHKNNKAVNDLKKLTKGVAFDDSELNTEERDCGGIIYDLDYDQKAFY